MSNLWASEKTWTLDRPIIWKLTVLLVKYHSAYSDNFTDHEPIAKKERRVLSEIFMNWFDEAGTNKMLTMSMLYARAQELANELGLTSIDKPRAFVDGFMRTHEVRISDTPYMINYNSQLKLLKEELYEFCNERHGSEQLNKAIVLHKGLQLKEKYELKDLSMNATWAESFITKNGFFFRSGQDR